jgi:hypothetical protein
LSNLSNVVEAWGSQKAMRQAWAQQKGATGFSVEATDVRLRIATSMERNLREGRLKVGMVVCRKTPT